MKFKPNIRLQKKSKLFRCKCCNKRCAKAVMHCLFDKPGKELNIQYMLYDFLKKIIRNVDDEDEDPAAVCTECLKELIKNYQFKRKFIKYSSTTEKKIKDRLSNEDLVTLIHLEHSYVNFSTNYPICQSIKIKKEMPSLNLMQIERESKWIQLITDGFEVQEEHSYCNDNINKNNNKFETINMNGNDGDNLKKVFHEDLLSKIELLSNGEISAEETCDNGVQQYEKKFNITNEPIEIIDLCEEGVIDIINLCENDDYHNNNNENKNEIIIDDNFFTPFIEMINCMSVKKRIKFGIPCRKINSNHNVDPLCKTNPLLINPSIYNKHSLKIELEKIMSDLVKILEDDNKLHIDHDQTYITKSITNDLTTLPDDDNDVELYKAPKINVTDACGNTIVDRYLFDFDKFLQLIIGIEYNEEKEFPINVFCSICPTDKFKLKNVKHLQMHFYIHFSNQKYFCILDKKCGSFENITTLNNHLFTEHPNVIE